MSSFVVFGSRVANVFEAISVGGRKASGAGPQLSVGREDFGQEVAFGEPGLVGDWLLGVVALYFGLAAE